MSTFLSLHINTNDQSHLVKLLEGLSNADSVSSGAYPEELYDNILMDENADPTFMAVSTPHDGWIHININSFKKHHQWVEYISRELNTSVIQVIAQNTSDCYYFLMYTNGQLRREIDIFYDDFDMTVDKGEKFPFEPASIIPVTEKDYDNLFDISTIESYCKSLGFDLFQDLSKDTYTILKKKNSITTLKQITKQFKKPWWKFW